MDAVRLARGKLLLAAALFSTGGAAIKAVAATPWQVAAVRSALGAATLWLVLPEARRAIGRRTFLVGLAYAGTVLLFVLANRTTTSANAIFLQSTAPLYLLVLGPLWLDEPFRRRELPVVLLVGAGLACFFVGGEPWRATAPDPGLGNLLAAGSGVCWALTLAGMRWLSRDAGPPRRSDVGGGAGGPDPGPRGSAAGAAVVGNLVAAAIAAPFSLPLSTPSLSDAGLLAYLGVVQIGVSYVLLTRATRHVRALDASLLLLLEPVLNPVWAFLFHDERPGAWACVGGGLVLCGTVLLALRAPRGAAGGRGREGEDARRRGRGPSGAPVGR